MQNDGNATILLIEDDLILSQLYEDKFTLDGFSIMVAHDGEKGLQMALAEEYDILLLDVGLPRKNGLDVLAELRGSPSGREVPVIVLTNLVEKNERSRAMKLGAKEYLVKAMQTPEQVVEKVKLHLHK